MTQTVREIMIKQLVTVEMDTSLTVVARRMRDAGIGDVLVVEDGRLRGVATDRDLVVRAMAEGKDPEHTAVRAVCSTELVSIGPDDEVDTAVMVMRRNALRRLPVTQDGRPVGIVSLGDLAIERDRASALADISAARPNT
jgi:signal-transduction protein with cAMP-binding, CBS, and nucleotidyltransferase domain